MITHDHELVLFRSRRGKMQNLEPPSETTKSAIRTANCQRWRAPRAAQPPHMAQTEPRTPVHPPVTTSSPAAAAAPSGSSTKRIHATAEQIDGRDGGRPRSLEPEVGLEVELLHVQSGVWQPGIISCIRFEEGTTWPKAKGWKRDWAPACRSAEVRSAETVDDDANIYSWAAGVAAAAARAGDELLVWDDECGPTALPEHFWNSHRLRLRGAKHAHVIQPKTAAEVVTFHEEELQASTTRQRQRWQCAVGVCPG